MGAQGAGPGNGDASEKSLRYRMISGLLDALTAFVGWMPLSVSSAIARGIGRTWVALSGPRTQRVRVQLAAAFPNRTPSEREAWTRGVFEHLAQGLAELLVMRGKRAGALVDQVEIRGLEHLRAAEAATARGGVLVVSAHLGNWELACAKVATFGIPLSVVYRGLEEPALDQILLDLRSRAIESVGHNDEGGDGVNHERAEVQQIQMGHAGFPVVRALESGRKVLMLLDQNAKREEGVFVSFFGRDACTRSGPVKLAMARNVPIVPAFIRRNPNQKGHCVEFGPAVPLVSGGDEPEEANEVLRTNVQRVTQAIEEAIRVDPSQWIWTHRRWRTQPYAPPRSPETEPKRSV